MEWRGKKNNWETLMECNEMRKKNSEADRPIKKKNEGSKIGDDSSLQIQSFAWPMGKRGWKGTNQWGRWRRRHWRIQLATASEAGESRESGQTNWQRPRREAKAKHVRIACNNFANFPPPTPRRNVWSLSLRLKKKNNEIYFFFRRCCDVNLDINQFDHAPYSAHSAEIVHFFIAMKLSLYFFYGGTVVISFFLDFKMIFFRDGILISSPLKWINFF